MSGYMNNFTVESAGNPQFQPRINVHKNNYSQFQKGPKTQGAGPASVKLGPPGGSAAFNSRQQSSEHMTDGQMHQIQNISVLSGDAFAQIYQTQQAQAKRQGPQPAGPQYLASTHEMQLRQAYGPASTKQKPSTSRGKQVQAVATNKSRRLLVQSDGFGNLLNNKP